MSSIKNEELFNTILENDKSIDEYYPYPTSSMGEVIAETDNHNGRKLDPAVKSLVSLMVRLGASLINSSPDNKTAVKVTVRGLDYPVFFCMKDNRYTISKGVNPMDNQAPIRIHSTGQHLVY